MAGPTWVLNNDLVAISRGRAVVDYDPTASRQPTVGWVPADLALDAFGGLVENRWGPIGDLRLRPDPSTHVEIDTAPGRVPPFRFVLADCTEVDGGPWDSCPRTILTRAVDSLEQRFGLRLLAAFEHEFALLRDDVPIPFSIDAGRRAEPLLIAVIEALVAAGIEPENVLPEFGHNQLEVTAAPAVGVGAADRAVIVREIIREVGRARGEALTFAPVIGPGAGTNGAHLHLSLLDTDDRPILGDPRRPSGLSPVTGRFAAGIMAHLPALTALTAPSVASYLRLRPRSWSAAYRAFGVANREAAVRVPLRPPADGPGNHSLELRSSDATANPYLALAGVIHAGMDGLERALDLPPSVDVDPADLDPDQRTRLGIERLPSTLDEAIEALAADDVVGAALATEELAACWFNLKRAEVERFRSAAPHEIVEAYADAY